MFQLSPSDADWYWYLGRVVFGVAIVYMLFFIFEGDPIPWSSVDFWVGIFLLLLSGLLGQLSDSTPLHEEIDFDDR